MEFTQYLRPSEHTKLTGSLDNQLDGSNLPPSPLILYFLATSSVKLQISDFVKHEADLELWFGMSVVKIWPYICTLHFFNAQNIIIHSLAQCSSAFCLIV